MPELISLPASIRTRLEQAQTLAIADKPDEALAIHKEAMTALAHSQPELYALLLAGILGYRQISATVQETRQSTVVVEQKMFGYVIGRNVYPSMETTTTTRTLRLG